MIKPHKINYLRFIAIAIILIAPSQFFTHDSFAINHWQSKTPEKPSQDLAYAKQILLQYHLDSANIDSSIEIISETLSNDPDNLEALLLLSRAWLTYGYAKAPTKKEMIRVFENGKSAAQKAIALDPNNPDTQFYYVANLASLGDTKGVFRSLFMLGEIREKLDLILELDPNHTYGLAMYGALYQHLPSFVGGDLFISEIYLRRALSIDPHLTTAKLYLGMNLMKQEKYEEARSILIEFLQEKTPTFYADWYINRRFAMRLISDINDTDNN